MTGEQVSFLIQASDWDVARARLFTQDGCENAGVFLCGVSRSVADVRLLAREFVAVPNECYAERLSYHLEIAPAFYNAVVSRCEATGLHPVIIHSHPGPGSAFYSASDDRGEKRLLSVLQSLLPDRIVASLVTSLDSTTGRRLVGGRFEPLSGMRLIGVNTRFGSFAERDDSLVDQRFDRQVRAFGVDNQRVLQRLRLGIVGVGGTGSVVAEQVARLGVGEIVLVDDDELEAVNLNRVIGATPSDIGKAKVDVIGQHLRSIGARSVLTLKASALKQDVLLQLRACDAVFSCVDNDSTRAVLNRFAYQYLMPVVDMGVRLDGRSGAIVSVGGRVTIVGPGMTCLRCSHHLNADRIFAESLPAGERETLAKEGYVMGLLDPAPSVISLNATVSSLGVTGFLNLFVGLTGGVQPTTQIYDATAGSVFTVEQQHAQGCDICDESTGVKGLGDKQLVSAY